VVTQAGVVRQSGIVLAKLDEITDNGLAFRTSQLDFKKEVVCQSVSLGHQLTYSIELASVMIHQSIVDLLVLPQILKRFGQHITPALV
jgi:hypothetical protein